MIQQIQNINNKEITYRGIDTRDIDLNLFSEKFHESQSENPCTVCGRKTNLTIGVQVGAGGSATGIETRYGAMLLFHMPAAGSESRVRLLGATQQLLTAVSLGAR